MQTYVAVYASRAYDHLPCPDAQARCRKAVEVALRHNAKIVIGSKMANPDPLCDATYTYLASLGFPTERIIKNPKGAGTIEETQAIAEAINHDGGGEIIAISAWYHIIRVWLIWRIVMKRSVRIRCSWQTYPWHNCLRELLVFPRTFSKILEVARVQKGA